MPVLVNCRIAIGKYVKKDVERRRADEIVAREMQMLCSKSNAKRNPRHRVPTASPTMALTVTVTSLSRQSLLGDMHVRHLIGSSTTPAYRELPLTTDGRSRVVVLDPNR